MSDKIKTIIADDEPNARKKISGLADNIEQLEVITECKDGVETYKAIKEKNPDLVFLDIQMPELDGFEVLQKLNGAPMPYIIFVTAYDEFALEAFEVNAVDYLLKPFDKSRFESAVKKVLDHKLVSDNSQSVKEILETIENLENSDSDGQNKIMIKENDEIFFLDADKIDRIESAGNYVKIFTGDKHHMIRETMGNMLKKLDSKTFFRIHRSCIVNINRVKVIEPWFHGDYQVELEDGKQLNMSRNYKRILKEF